MFFLHLMLFPAFLEKNNSGNKKYIYNLMVFLCYIVDLFPTFLDFFLEILKSNSFSFHFAIFGGIQRVLSCQYCFFTFYE